MLLGSIIFSGCKMMFVLTRNTLITNVVVVVSMYMV